MLKTRSQKIVGLIFLAIISLTACRAPNPIFNPPPTLPAATIPITAVATPAAVLAPTPTYDLTLPDWTIMLYASVDNELAPFTWADLNEMEAAGASDRINVVAQVDWPTPAPESGRPGPETLRYSITADEATDQLSSPAESIGEQNMGDPATLASFLTWAMSKHPANRYALILTGYGAGWHGVALDGDVGVPEQVDYLSLGDLDQALRSTLETAGRDRLDVITLNASLMGQLDVLQALQPYSRYAVASADLVPGAGWDFELLLSQLYATPNTEPDVFAVQTVADYVNVQTQLLGNDSATMAAFDLSRLPAVAAAVESLAGTLLQQPELVADAAGDARRGVQGYGLAVPMEAEQFAAIDLHYAMSILVQRSPLESVAVAARAVALAVESAILAHDFGAALPQGRGLALYWPALAEFHNVAYSEATSLSNWETFINGYVNAPPGPIAPQVNVSGTAGDTASIQQPALIAAELTGRQIGDLAFLVAQPMEDGRRLVLRRQTVPPSITTLDDGTQLAIWEDGLHEQIIVWNPSATFLQDTNGNGAYVVTWPAAAETPEVIEGQFRPRGQQVLYNGNLVFPTGNATPSQLWGARPSGGMAGNMSAGNTSASNTSAGNALAEIPLESIDAFQPTLYVVQDDGRLVTEPGPLLPLAPDQPLSRKERPLPDGPYQAGLSAVSSGGVASTAWNLFTVTNTGLTAGYTTYFDSEGGFQFLYPAAWEQPSYQDSLLVTNNVSNTITLQLQQFPQWSGDATALQAEALQTFGQVSLLFEEDLALGRDDAISARRVAYGYDHPQSGGRTGVFISFVHNGTGYVVDVDGPQTAESETMAVANVVAESWRFIEIDLNGGWTTLELGNTESGVFHVPKPVAYHAETSDEWQRLSTNHQHFIAYRLQPATREPGDAVRALVQSAGQGVANFTPGDPYPLLLGGVIWQRADFSYLNSDGIDVIGLIMVRVEANQEMAAWAEAPAAEFGELSENVFLVSAAGLRQEIGD